MHMLLEIGVITKAQGLKGEVLVHLFTDRHERMAAGSVLQTARGPLTVVWAKPHQDRWRVQFEGIADRTKAEAMARTILLAEPIDDPDAFFVHELIGSEVVTSIGERIGIVEAVEANPASDMLVLDGERLVPLVFITERRPGQLVAELPHGLFDLD
jgi:16S rRNA processing protein RimM